MPDLVEVDAEVEEVSCNGGKTFGHPRIYMALGDDGSVECYYCGRRFQRRGSPSDDVRENVA